MFVYTNGLWGGFNEKTDGIHFGFFEHVLSQVFGDAIHLTDNIRDADILLESHFTDSKFLFKNWRYSIFFSGEGKYKIPSHAYTFVMGAQPTGTHFISCPLYVVYDYCKPVVYPTNITTVPTKNLCSVISSPESDKSRENILNMLKLNNIHVDNAGGLNNNLGFTVSGNYYQQPILDFYKQYKIVCAFENTMLDDYITEKILNSFRAGTIPLYLGSEKISEYFNPLRFIEVNKDDIQITVNEINKLLTDESYWLYKVNQPIFKRSTSDIIETIIQQMKALV
jgi:hypothetical protein